ncbi:hypothetical protein BSKO_12802 [Bryopsis sp. KO-2023]|nr:hypothetical protein BSKO_12802 [Bryopsis sp. KO-2023]
MYHEKQRLMFCLEHCINNLFQSQVVTSWKLDEYAEQLTPTRFFLYNPHRTPFLGNYDVNVLELALGDLGKSLSWCDCRDPTLPNLDLNDDGLFGLIINKPSTNWIARNVLGGRHWFSLKKINSTWYDLDSGLPEGQAIESIRGYLHTVVFDGGHLFIVK